MYHTHIYTCASMYHRHIHTYLLTLLVEPSPLLASWIQTANVYHFRRKYMHLYMRVCALACRHVCERISTSVHAWFVSMHTCHLAREISMKLIHNQISIRMYKNAVGMMPLWSKKTPLGRMSSSSFLNRNVCATRKEGLFVSYSFRSYFAIIASRILLAET